MTLKFLESRFARNVLTLSSGAAIAQAISILSAPINARLYLPADYGALGAYMSVSGLASTAATLFFHYPIVLTERDEDARALVAVSFLSSLLVALVAGAVALLLGPLLAERLGAPELRWWLLVLPFSTICAGLGAACNAWVNRKSGYRLLASTRVVGAIIPAATTIGLGFALEGPTGLLVGLVASHIVLATTALWAARRTELSLRSVERAQMLALARRYREYPIFTMPTELISNWTIWLPVHLLIAFAGASAVGAYSMAARMLAMPTVLIGSSIGEVFRQQAAADCANAGECRSIFRQTVKSSTLVAFPVFLVVAAIGPELFALVFGEPWREAGRISRVLALLFAVQFVVSPVAAMYYVRHRLREDMLLHFLLLAVIAAGMGVVHLFSAEPLHLLAGYGLAYIVIYAVYLVRSYQLSGPQPA